jgi:F-type H+-transporting ATPase subunit a
MGFFEGLLELIAEFSRLIALSMRLFGNVFAGEVLLMIVTWLTQFASPILLPFLYIFEMFIGGIQAYVFFSLTVVFTGLAVAEHGPESEHSTKIAKRKLLRGVKA